MGELKQGDPAAARRPTAENAAAAENVADAAEEARSLAIAAEMHAAAGGLQENQIGQVTGQHKEIVENLQKVLDILANRRRHELSGLVKKQQAGRGGPGRTAAPRGRAQPRSSRRPPRRADPAKRKAETRAARRTSKRPSARRPGGWRSGWQRILAEEAGEHRGAGRRSDGPGRPSRPPGATRPPRPGRPPRPARRLDEARRKLAAQRFANQAELALEQLARLEDAIKHLHRQQQNVIDETRRLDELQRTAGAIDPGPGPEPPRPGQAARVAARRRRRGWPSN